MKTQNHYDILGLERSASGAEIKLAYRKLAHRFHPDVSKDPDGERKFKSVSEAYKTLNCLDTRAAYDHLSWRDHGGAEIVWNSEALDGWCARNPWRHWVWFCAGQSAN